MAISGGIAWATATLMYPELVDNAVVPVAYNDVVKYSERLANDFKSVTDSATIVKMIADKTVDKAAVAGEVKKSDSGI